MPEFISIGMPCYDTQDNGCHQYTKKCTELIMQNTVNEFQLIIINNGSTDPKTNSFLDELERNDKRVKVIRIPMNRGAPHAYNQIIKNTSSEYIFFLTNDIEVPEQWDEKLLNKLKENPKCAAVGFAPSHKGADLHRDREGFSYTIVMFGCSVFRRSVINEVGEVDEGFFIGMFEDDDYNYRMHKLGYIMEGIGPEVKHHSGTISRMDKEYIFRTNREYFNKKWAHEGVSK